MMNIDFNSFNESLMGSQYRAYWLTNKKGTKVLISSFGARIVSICCEDKNGNIDDIVLGYNSLKEYISGDPYYGSTCGRYANRIAKGKFDIDGVSYELKQNNHPNHLHGGPTGFQKKNWTVDFANDQKIQLSFISPDGHEGYPGNLKVKAIYELNEENQISVTYEAETDKATIINLCNHAYFNLKGEGNGTVCDHFLKINADYITPVNKYQIPTGHLLNVTGTPFEFSEFTQIEKQIHQADEQLEIGNKGYDINYVLSSYGFELAADIYEKNSGRGMKVITTQPGMQLYTANHMDGSDIGKSGKRYQKHAGFCMETQHFPDSPNHKDFPNTVLRPGEKYEQKTIFELYIKN